MKLEFKTGTHAITRTADLTAAPPALTAAISKRDSARLLFEIACQRHGRDPSLVLAEEEEEELDVDA